MLFKPLPSKHLLICGLFFKGMGGSISIIAVASGVCVDRRHNTHWR
jgi:hypothetical protein